MPDEATVMPKEASGPGTASSATSNKGHFSQTHANTAMGGAGHDSQLIPTRSRGINCDGGPNSRHTVWKVFSTSGGRVLRLIATDSKKANWMRNVRMATTRESQNLIACQVL